jgi:hypothetical protein
MYCVFGRSIQRVSRQLLEADLMFKAARKRF